MYLEYDWTFDVYRPRVGQTFTSFRGYYSFKHKTEAMAVLAQAGLALGRKTDTRTWEIVPVPENTI